VSEVTPCEVVTILLMDMIKATIYVAGSLSTKRVIPKVSELFCAMLDDSFVSK
jgi:hypothetical protein